MTYAYDKGRDRMVGHDFPGVHGSGFFQWELDELELGARVAHTIDDPDGDQWWWELIGNKALEQEKAHDRESAPSTAVPGS